MGIVGSRINPYDRSRYDSTKKQDTDTGIDDLTSNYRHRMDGMDYPMDHWKCNFLVWDMTRLLDDPMIDELDDTYIWTFTQCQNYFSLYGMSKHCPVYL